MVKEYKEKGDACYNMNNLKIKHQPLMIAYMSFLSFSVVWHLVCKIFGLDFSAWQKIIVAATVASYFFSFASGNKYFVRVYKELLKFQNDDLTWLQKMKSRANQLPQNDSLVEEIEKCIENDISSIEKSQRKINKSETWAFRFDVVGYLIFLCVLVVDPLYFFLAKSQDVLTLLAFLAILSIEYNENLQMEMINNAREKATVENEKILDTVEQFKKSLPIGLVTEKAEENENV